MSYFKKILRCLTVVTLPLKWIFYAESVESSRFIRSLARGLIWWIIFSSPFLYDGAVPNPSSDLRWSVLHLGVLFAIVLMATIWNSSKDLEVAAPPAIWLLLSFLLVAGLSQIDALDPFRARSYFTHLASCIGLTSLIYWLRHEQFFNSILWAMILPILPISLLGIVQYHGIQTSDLPSRLQWINLNFFHENIKMVASPAATYVNKNMAADYLTMVLPLCLWVVFQSGFRKWYLLISLILGGIFLLYTRCRASWVAISFSFLVFGVWIASTRRHNFRSGIRYVLTSLSIFFVVFSIGGMFAKNNSEVTRSGIIEHFKNVIGPTFETRLSLYVNTLMMAKDHWINGVGIGNFRNVYPLYHEAIRPTGVAYGMSITPDFVHNDIIQTFAELGLVGGVLICIVYVLSLRAGLKSLNSEISKDKPIHIRVIPMVIAMGCIGMLTDSLMSLPLQKPGGATMFFAGLGILLGFATICETQGTWRIDNYFTQRKTFKPLVTYGTFTIAMWTFWVQFKASVNQREASKHLKVAVESNVNDIRLQAITKSMQLYPDNDLAREIQAYLYSAYDGQLPLSDDARILVIESFRKTTPYSAGLLVNYAHFLVNKIEDHKISGEKKKAYRDILSEIHEILEKIAPFSEYTQVIGAEISIFNQEIEKAAHFLEKAKAINAIDPWTIQCFEKLARHH